MTTQGSPQKLSGCNLRVIEMMTNEKEKEKEPKTSKPVPIQGRKIGNGKFVGDVAKRIEESKDSKYSQEHKVYLAALAYIEVGWYLLPLMSNGKKLPRKDTNINYGSASKKKKVIDGWFNPDSGRFRGYNIGIACGREGGAFVIDVDRHDDIDGLDTLERLEKQNSKLPKCPVAKTPNDGFHFFFPWQEHCSQSTGKIGKGIDTRGGDATSCKGHVVAYPSIINGKRYEWVDFPSTLSDIPAWVLESMGALWKPRPNAGRGNANVTDDDLERPIEEPQVVSMINSINPDDCEYEDWLKAGMSIKSQLNNPRGLEIWDEWSQKGKRYKAGECQIRWDGFSDFGTVRGGTLFYMAGLAGWEPDKEKGERSGNPYDLLVEELNQTYAVVTMGGKIRILREHGNVVNEWEMHYDLLDKQAFIDLLSNEKIMSSGPKPKPVPVTTIWFAHEGRRTYSRGLALFPLERAPQGFFNTWHGFSVEPIEGECSLFLDHLHQIVCGGNDKQYKWLITWLADLVQDPSNPKGCAVVMRGGEGCGKGTFANAIGKLFGPHHRHLIDDSHLTSNFNSHLFDAITIFADEITWGGNKKTAGKLKGMVTEAYLIGERKGVDAIQYHNRGHLLVASNADWVIPAGRGSRRWFVLDVLGDRISNFAYFNEIDDELNNGGLEALLWHLQNIKIKPADIDLIRKALVTEGLKKQRNLANSDHTHDFFVYLLQRGKSHHCPSQGHYWKSDEIQKDYQRWCNDNRARIGGENVRGDTQILKEMYAAFNGEDSHSPVLMEGKRARFNKDRITGIRLSPLYELRSRINMFVEGAFEDVEDQDKRHKEGVVFEDQLYCSVTMATTLDITPEDTEIWQEEY